jgi:hypothetical protein
LAYCELSATPPFSLKAEAEDALRIANHGFSLGISLGVQLNFCKRAPDFAHID